MRRAAGVCKGRLWAGAGSSRRLSESERIGQLWAGSVQGEGWGRGGETGRASGRKQHGRCSGRRETERRMHRAAGSGQRKKRTVGKVRRVVEGKGSKAAQFLPHHGNGADFGEAGAACRGIWRDMRRKGHGAKRVGRVTGKAGGRESGRQQVGSGRSNDGEQAVGDGGCSKWQELGGGKFCRAAESGRKRGGRMVCWE